ncbi:ead/Ea22-like family protein [Klebsiella michiganensis]
MTTDITELAQSLKEAAEKATPGQWVAFTDTATKTFAVHTPNDKRCENIIKWAGFDCQKNAKANAEFIALANPANALALVEALEKAQHTTTEMENRIRKQNRHVCELFDDNTALRQRIAELESRSVKLPSELELRNNEVCSVCAGNALQVIEDKLTAAGIKVEAE